MTQERDFEQTGYSRTELYRMALQAGIDKCVEWQMDVLEEVGNNGFTAADIEAFEHYRVLKNALSVLLKELEDDNNALFNGVQSYLHDRIYICCR